MSTLFFQSQIESMVTVPVNMGKLVKVGAVQAEPVWLDLQGGVEKTISIIKKAGADGVNVLGFPEVFIPGYPWYAVHSSSVIVDEADNSQEHLDDQRAGKCRIHPQVHEQLDGQRLPRDETDLRGSQGGRNLCGSRIF